MSSSSSNFSYQKLRKLPTGEAYDDEDCLEQGRRIGIIQRGGEGGGRWWRRRRWRRARVRVVGLMRRAVRRRAAAVRAAVAAALEKVMKRIREGRPYVGDLFAGNYLFMQVNPSGGAAAAAAVRYWDRNFSPAAKLNHGGRHLHNLISSNAAR
ncbi:hypothetical protein AXF42_Ash016850 [Apostasia shenzhenica]|uniref:Uncharacterized protein n=1 Tax=Apostasia shenzhenica TaxID=1088818 RepID=A0A2I0BAM5_9ASPA|nr:hypothetical protein AXF42_Ash016850 [Apostasia shenzhenica]